MLYTVADVDFVMSGSETKQKTNRREITVECGKLECTLQNGALTVTRLISTDPKQYLNKSYSPGAVWKAK